VKYVILKKKIWQCKLGLFLEKKMIGETLKPPDQVEPNGLGHL
jgi:hypothetical protein